MEAKELVKTEKTVQKIQLVKGEFTPSETCDVILALIDQKINFHKLQRLQRWEGNHDGESGQLDGRIKELEEEKRVVKEFIASNRGMGHNFKINGILEITLKD